MDSLDHDLDHIHALDLRFGIPGLARIVAGAGGLPVVRISTPAAHAEISLYGAQVLSYIPADGSEVIFLSSQSHWERGRAIRGGIPVCFPWFGDKADDPAAPKHGYARIREWRLDSLAALEDGSVTLLCVLESDEDGLGWFPHPFCAAYRITVGAALRLEFTVINTGSEPMRFEEALHTYFRVGDVLQTRVLGLDGGKYLDKTDGFRQKQQSGDIAFGSETDRVFLGAHQPVTLVDDGLVAGGQSRSIVTAKTGSENTVVWNPAQELAATLADLGDEEWRQMVCIEGANVGASAILLGPGEEHTMRVTITAAPD